MTKIKKIARFLLIGGLVIYSALCIGLYCFQENIIFVPTKLPDNFEFNFAPPFEEHIITTSDNEQLSTLLFTTDSVSKGVIFYLHGNAGSLRSWGNVAMTYTQRGYDVWLMDYRGYGKSTGEILSEQHFFDDAQLVYDFITTKYTEEQITVLGYSIGTGTAAMLAANNTPKQLILQAPYYSLVDMMQQQYPIVPTFLLNYRFETGKFIQEVEAPIIVFHGTADRVIYYGSSLKLQEHFKPTDTLITLPNGRHNGMHNTDDYLNALDNIL